MMNQNIKEHLSETLKKGVRYDGRKLDEFRSIEIETDVSTPAEGSATVRIGDTEVMAGVKIEMQKPYDDSADSGTLMVNAEFSPMADPKFESGPPSIDSIELARVIDRGIRESESIDVKKLCIVEGEKVWSVGIDLITINNAGNLLDCAGLAAVAAIKNAKLPEVDKEGNADYKHKSKNGLPIEKEPISVTIHVIGDTIIADPSREEEEASDARLTVASISKDVICAMQKGGSKALTVEQVDEMVDLALKKAEEIRKIL